MSEQTVEINDQEMTLEQFVTAAEAHGPTVERFYANQPVECADLDLSLVAALIAAKFPGESPIVVLSQEDFIVCLTGAIQIGYTLARRVDAGTLNAEATEDEGNEASDQ